ncbi:MAG: hypothetical protein LBU76_10740 [Azoarcus sp.]|nr:hypothetical protein [Azoarcus sp.]
MNVTRAEVSRNASSQEQEMILYTVFEKDFNARLILKAFDKNHKEIGRSAVSVQEQSDSSRFVGLPFDSRTSFSLIQYFILEHRSN